VARRYPLEALLGVRQRRVDAQARDHAAALVRSEQQSAAHRAARAHREHSERALAVERSRERERLEAGTTRAHDLQQGERHLVGGLDRVATLRAREAEAAKNARRAEHAREGARAVLARARADEKAALEHQRRFREAEEQAREQSAEEASLEHFSVSRHGARRG